MLIKPTDYQPEVAANPCAPRTGWRNMSELQHFVLFYERDEFLLSELSGYIGTGLLSGDAAIVVATPDHHHGLERLLRLGGVDVDSLIGSGCYLPLDAAGTLSRVMIEGTPDPDRVARVLGGIIEQAAEGGRKVRIFGEMVALLCAEGNHAAAIRLEDLWNELSRQHRFALFCAYPMRALSRRELAGVVIDVCASHSGVIPAESYTQLQGDAERLRAIAVLQQKAHSLELEPAGLNAGQDARVAEPTLSSHQREALLSSLSHDLRTPLTVVHGQAQLLRRRAARGTLDDGFLLEALDQIETRSREMSSLVNEKLNTWPQRSGEEA